MAEIKKLRDKNGNVIYPATSIKAIYGENETRLDNMLSDEKQRVNQSLESKQDKLTAGKNVTIGTGNIINVDIPEVEKIELTKDTIEDALTHTINASVPHDAKFTDTNTVYTAGENITIDEDNTINSEGGSIDITKDTVEKALGHTINSNVPINAKFTDTIVDVSTKADVSYVDEKLNEKVDNSKVLTPVPEGAIFTDTVTEVVDNLETDSSEIALSARQGMQLFQSVSSGKELIATSITDKGVDTSGSDTFKVMAGNIDSIEVGTGGGYQAGDYIGESKISEEAIQDLWSKKMPSETVWTLGVDEEREVIWASVFPWGTSERVQYDYSGNMISKVSLANKPYEYEMIVYESDGSVIIRGHESIFKLDKSQRQLWEIKEKANAIGAFPNGDIAYNIGDRYIYIISSNGKPVAKYYSTLSTFNAIRVDRNGYIYAVGKDYIEKISPDLERVYFHRLSPSLHRSDIKMALNDKGEVFVSAMGQLHKYDTNGENVWTQTRVGGANTSNDIMVNSKGNIYFGGNASSVIELDTNGDEVGRYRPFNYTAISNISELKDETMVISGEVSKDGYLGMILSEPSYKILG